MDDAQNDYDGVWATDEKESNGPLNPPPPLTDNPPLDPASVDLLNVFCPMHVVLNANGYIVYSGPAIQKLRPEEPLIGRWFFELFETRRPYKATTTQELLQCAGVKLQLSFRDAPRTRLTGALMPRPIHDGVVINMSFGISVLDAVKEYSLSATDFAATDLTVEMLYLVEAKSAAMESSRTLNQRLQGAKIAAEEQAFTDTLTGLKNRRAMDHVLGRAIEQGRKFALMQVDLDYFKAVNDTLGHAAGDHVLQCVARIMVEETRSEDTVARVGGDEFVIMFSGLTKRSELEAVAYRLIGRLEETIHYKGEKCRISGSAGTVLSSDYETPDADRMLSDADMALYASKHRGRACHTFFSSDLRQVAEQARDAAAGNNSAEHDDATGASSEGANPI